jgi:tRNA A37 threonylcarbamoyladenosine dehydratase
MENWQARTELCLGTESASKLRISNVLVVGLGGVGAYAAEMICRAGVGKMTIVDGDVINRSNRNRQLPALVSTEGLPKTEVMAQRLMDINPDLDLTVIQEFIRENRIVEILDPGFDYVVDAIDTLSPKVFLIYNSLKKGYPVVSSMGAGGKLDPTQVTVADISETTDCSLARILRKRLHRLGVREGFKAVYSRESVEKDRVSAIEGEKNKASIVGTISYMPAAFGIACASVVLRDLSGNIF